MHLLCSESPFEYRQSRSSPRYWVCETSLTPAFPDRWVAFIAGKVVISLPKSTQTATVPGGRHGLILAADTANVSTLGHITKYPSKQETVGIQIPTANNEVPPHTVLHEGACVNTEEND